MDEKLSSRLKSVCDELFVIIDLVRSGNYSSISEDSFLCNLVSMQVAQVLSPICSLAYQLEKNGK